MSTSTEKILRVSIEDELKSSYIDYSMSVIVARALPDVRDGLKPVHRRILFGMSELGLSPTRAYKKSARIVGEVLGKYHPHGDSAVYDTMVRMVQDFSLRYPLVQGQGNFGSVDGDSAAAMRYTEARMAPIAMEMLRDLEKDTVDYAPNFDDSLQEPRVLPALLPNLLVNGSGGIAVGMATNIPPHNLGEIVDGLLAMIETPDLRTEDLIKLVKAPDFPTGGIIFGYQGVQDAYLTGRGKIIVRGRANVETLKNGRENIIISEIPYQVNKANLIEKVAELVKAGKIDGVSNIRDESDRDGMRIVIETKRDGNPEVVLNNLYKHTQMQVTFGAIMLALVDGRPKVLTLKEMMQHFLDFRHDVVVRRTKFELAEAERRAHILEGYLIALDNIDEVIETIKKSRDVETARTNLMRKFKLSEIQAKAILDMRLQRLTGLERKKIEDEYKETIKLINRLRGILENAQLRWQVIGDELRALRDKYNDPRRTEVIYDYADFKLEDMIAEEDVVITISHQGYIKRTPVSTYRRQGRGGKGVAGSATREDDFVEHMFIASTHHYILFFTDKGRCYWLKVFEVPEGGRTARGRAIINLINKQKDENVAAFVTVKEFTDTQFIMMVTGDGTVKKTVLSAYGNPRSTGIIAIHLSGDDNLIDAKITDGGSDILIATRNGQAIRFNETDVRDMGRNATGVRGISLAADDVVIGMVVGRPNGNVLVVSEHGYGKRSEVASYRHTKRGGKGVITMNVTEKTGLVIAIKEVSDQDDIVIITERGLIIRQHVRNIRVMGRNTQGVRLIDLRDGDSIADIARVGAEEDLDPPVDEA
ncbi:MAG: DNA gyrase subunit A [Bacteroidota bacterium]|jgi:DNA gyrase subunit A|nr:DNA gyrase subunit A [Bacteroidota bacterium]